MPIFRRFDRAMNIFRKLVAAAVEVPRLAQDMRLLRHAAADQLRAALLSDPRYADLRQLARFEQRGFSQHGEDGILQEIFRRIGTRHRTFVEFGVGDGLENNTALLLASGDWRGGWIEGDAGQVATIRRHAAPLLVSGRLQLVQAYIDAANIDGLIAAFGFPADVDLLSVDIDGNDLWVWKAIRCIQPRVVVVEYNATFPATMRWTMPYDAAHRYGSDNFHGASLAALSDLATDLGYVLVGCDLAGVNAFFVRSELVGDAFADTGDLDRLYEPRRVSMSVPPLKRRRLV